MWSLRFLRQTPFQLQESLTLGFLFRFDCDSPGFVQMDRSSAVETLSTTSGCHLGEARKEIEDTSPGDETNPKQVCLNSRHFALKQLATQGLNESEIAFASFCPRPPRYSLDSLGIHCLKSNDRSAQQLCQPASLYDFLEWVILFCHVRICSENFEILWGSLSACSMTHLLFAELWLVLHPSHCFVLNQIESHWN